MEIHSARDDIFLTPGAVTRHGRFVEAKAQPYKFADSSYWDRQPGEPDDDEWEDNYYDGDDGNDNNDDGDTGDKKKKDDDDDGDRRDSTSDSLQNAGRGDGQHEARRRANDLNPQHQEGPGPDGRAPIPGKSVDRYFEDPEAESLWNQAFGDRPGGQGGFTDPSPFGPQGDGHDPGMSDDEYIDRFMQGGDRPGGSSGLTDPTTKPGHNSSRKRAEAEDGTSGNDDFVNHDPFDPSTPDGKPDTSHADPVFSDDGDNMRCKNCGGSVNYNYHGQNFTHDANSSDQCPPRKQAKLPPWMDKDGNDVEDDDEQKKRNKAFDDSLDFPDGKDDNKKNSRRRLADSKEFNDSQFHAPHDGQKCSRWQHGDPAPAAVACRESGGNHYGCCSTHKTEMTKGASDETNADGADPEDVRAEDDDNTVGPNETFIKDPGGKESRTASYDSNWSLFL